MAIIYTNSKTNIPYWISGLHNEQPIGFAYVDNDYSIHIYGVSKGLWTLSTGLTVSEKNVTDLKSWVIDKFGAKNIQEAKNNIGEVTQCVWRPGLYYQNEIHQAFDITQHQQWDAEQSLRILIEKLNKLLLYIEPSKEGINTYSHKTRELLILACTEVENTWTYYMELAGRTGKFNTNDYVKLCSPLFLKEYQIEFKIHEDTKLIQPFKDWQPSDPSMSLIWYDSYNKTKHHRNKFFEKATLLRCIEAIAANIVLFCVRFGPYSLFQSQTPLSALANQLFNISLNNPNPENFYIPKIKFPDNYHSELAWGNASNFIQSWSKKPFLLG